MIYRIKNIFLIILFLAYQPFLQAQSPNMEFFNDLFEPYNVGILHIHVPSEEVPMPAYEGQKEIPFKFRSYLPISMHKRMLSDKIVPKAVGTVRGNGLEDMYILSAPNKTDSDKIALYKMKRNRLAPIKTLASYSSTQNKSVQLDSWLVDLNGDTRLDILQKSLIIRANGKTTKNTNVYLQNPKGKFKKVNANNYVKPNFKMISLPNSLKN